MSRARKEAAKAALRRLNTKARDAAIHELIAAAREVEADAATLGMATRRLSAALARVDARAAHRPQPAGEAKPCASAAECTTPKLCASVGDCKGMFVLPANVRAGFAAAALTSRPVVDEAMVERACAGYIDAAKAEGCEMANGGEWEIPADWMRAALTAALARIGGTP